MKARDTRFPIEAWIRKCQECGNVQTDKAPTYGVDPSNAYNNRKCKRCKSEALDYGTPNETNEDWDEE